MIIKKRIEAKKLRDIMDLPEDIQDDVMVNLTMDCPNPGKEQKVWQAQDLRRLFLSRIQAAKVEEQFTDEVFTTEEISWEDLNEVKAQLEEEGYGVKVEQQGDRIYMKVLWRYA